MFYHQNNKKTIHNYLLVILITIVIFILLHHKHFHYLVKYFIKYSLNSIYHFQYQLQLLQDAIIYLDFNQINQLFNVIYLIK